MGSERVERRLAAILNADVVGYSRMMARDEVATLRTLKAHVDLMGGLVRQHGGRVVDAVGDNLLAESLERRGCRGVRRPGPAAARGAQRGPAAGRPHALPHRDQPRRVATVPVETDRIAGDGVNVAARIQALAEPGGVWISGAVFEQVEGKLPFAFEDRGEQKLKNVPRPVRVFRVVRTPRSHLDPKRVANRPVPSATRFRASGGAPPSPCCPSTT